MELNTELMLNRKQTICKKEVLIGCECCKKYSNSNSIDKCLVGVSAAKSCNDKRSKGEWIGRWVGR